MTFLSNLLGRIAAALLDRHSEQPVFFFPTSDPAKVDIHLQMLLGRIFRRETVIRLNSLAHSCRRGAEDHFFSTV